MSSPKYHDDDPLKEDAAGAYILRSPRTMQTWRQQGKGPEFEKHGKNVIYRFRKLREYAERNTKRSTKEG